jgi:hypothetical protein
MAHDLTIRPGETLLVVAHQQKGWWRHARMKAGQIAATLKNGDVGAPSFDAFAEVLAGPIDQYWPGIGGSLLWFGCRAEGAGPILEAKACAGGCVIRCDIVGDPPSLTFATGSDLSMIDDLRRPGVRLKGAKGKR